MSLIFKKGTRFYFVGIKGSGMSAMAFFLSQKGFYISGTDTDSFYPTQKVLEKAGIHFNEDIDNDDLPFKTEIVIYSPAYEKTKVPSLKKAYKNRLLIYSYPEFLGILSKEYFSIAICGTHGKTTTTAILGSLIKSLGYKGSVLAGSPVKDWDNFPVYNGGEDFFIAEVCEYRRHFLNFFPNIMVILNIEWEHVDYFSSFEDVLNGFLELAHQLPKNGILIYCQEDEGAKQLALRVSEDRKDIQIIAYGLTKLQDKKQEGFFLSSLDIKENFQFFKIQGVSIDLYFPLIGKELILNVLAALTTLNKIGDVSYLSWQKVSQSLKYFKGVSRRQEKLGFYNGCLVMDDYAHHPKEIDVILKGIRQFYINRRLIVDFMFHTVSRTEIFLYSFEEVLSQADILIIHPIYASARESLENSDRLIKKFLTDMREKYPYLQLLYFKSFSETYKFLERTLNSQDIFITLGAGNNFEISHKIVESNS